MPATHGYVRPARRVEAVHRCFPAHQATILDVGCGSGQTAEESRRTGSYRDVFAADVAERPSMWTMTNTPS